MENTFRLDFLPTYGSRFFNVAIIGLVCSIMLLIVMEVFKLDTLNSEVIKWIIAFLFSVMIFSKEKAEHENSHALKYYAGKIAIILLIGVSLGMRATELIMKLNLGLDYINLLILGLATYTLTYQILKYLARGRKISIG